MNLNQLFNNKKSTDEKLKEGVDPMNYDSDWDYYDAVAKSGRGRPAYSRTPDDDDGNPFADYERQQKDFAIGRAKKAAAEKAQRDADHDRLATGTNEGVAEDDAGDVEQRFAVKMEKEKQRLAKLKQTDPEAYKREMAKRKTSSRIPPVSTFEQQGVAEDTNQKKNSNEESIEEGALKDQSLSALLQAKQAIEQQRAAELAAWERDFRANTAQRAGQQLKRAFEPAPVAQPGEKHSVLKSRLNNLNAAIQKQQYLDTLADKAEKLGLLNPGLRADADTSLYVRDGARDDYVTLNQRLDTAIQRIKDRISVSRASGLREQDKSMPEGMIESGTVEAWGYSYNNRDQRVMWRKMFDSKEAAMAWADRHNATVLGVRTPGQTVQEGTTRCVECGGPAYLSRYVAEEEKGCYSNHKLGKAQCRNMLETSELDEQAQPAKTVGMRNIGMIEKTRGTAEPVLLDYGSQKFRVSHPADKKWFLDTWRGYRQTGQENRFFEMMGTLVGFEKLLDQYAAFHARQTAAPQPKPARNKQVMPTQADLLEAPEDGVATPRAKKALTQLRMKYPHAANDAEAMLYSMLDTQEKSQQNVDNLEKTVQRDIDNKISKLSSKQLGSAAVNQIKATNDQQQQILNRIIKIDQAQQQAIDDLKSPGAEPSTYSRGDLTGVPAAEKPATPAPVSMPKPMPVPAPLPAVTPPVAATPPVVAPEPAAEPAGQGDTRLQLPLPRDKAAAAEPIDIGVAATKPSNVIPMKKSGKKPVQGRLFDPSAPAANVPMGIQRVAEAKKLERKLAKTLREQSK